MNLLWKPPLQKFNLFSFLLLTSTYFLLLTSTYFLLLTSTYFPHSVYFLGT